MHYHRLAESCQRLGFSPPIDEYAFEKAIVRTLKANELTSAIVRVTVSIAGDGPSIDRPIKQKTNVVIFCTKLPTKPPLSRSHGASLIVVQSVTGEDPATATIKSTSYLTRMLARREITTAGADEGIILSRDGHLLEGSSSNLFIVKNQTLFTPPISDGLLPGVTRLVIMGLAEQVKVPCIETSLTLDDLAKADEVFLTGSVKEIMPVRCVADIFKKKVPGVVTKQLIDAYQELVNQ